MERQTQISRTSQNDDVGIPKTTKVGTSPHDEAFANPGRGHRVFTVWRRNHTSTIYAITSDFAGPDAYLTIMFSSEY